MKTFAAVMIAVAAIAGPLAAQPASSPPLFHTEPMVLGQVTDMTSHSLSVNTSKGEQMEFEFDSGTLMPTSAQLTTGTPVKILFRTLDSGLRLAKRITALEHGSLDYAQLTNELAMLESQRSEETHASNLAPDPVEGSSTSQDAYSSTTTTTTETHTTAGVDETRSNASRPEAVRSADTGRTNTERSDEAYATSHDRDDELPRTASAQGWLLPAGVGALLLAVALRTVRRRRAA